jgi:iron complex outermembrane recepter protein
VRTTRIAVTLVLALLPATAVTQSSVQQVAQLADTAAPVTTIGLLDRPARLRIAETSLETALMMLTRASGVSLAFSPTRLPPDARVSCACDEVTVRAALDQLLAGSGLIYLELVGQIVLVPVVSDSEPERRPADPGSVSLASGAGTPDAARTDAQDSVVAGVVENARGESLEEAQIVVVGTTQGTRSDARGHFRIEGVSGPEVRLRVTFVGYRPLTRTVTVGDQNVRFALEQVPIELAPLAVVGSRSGRARTNVDRPVPVDVLPAAELQATGQSEVAQMLQFLAPSFHSTKYGIVNVTAYVDPVTLRGMGTDQTLVLINGRRRHQSAAMNVNRVVGRGSVGTDINAIPAAAIERIEILREGAASQYGSDAIAGIGNIVLKDASSGGSITAKSGVSSRSDGELYDVSLNYGTMIGQKPESFLNTTFAFLRNEETDRKDTFRGFVYNLDPAVDASLIAANGFDRQRDVGTKFGQARSTMGSFFYNGGYPLGATWTAYSFGGLSYKDLLSFGFFRQPGAATRSVPQIFPKGFSPLYPASATDAQVSAGMRKTSPTGWSIDIGGTYGKNWLSTRVRAAPNASYGVFSPTEFFLGRNNFGHQTFSVDVARLFSSSNSARTFSLALGGEARREEYQITVGDRVSFTEGPDTTKEYSSAGKVGFSPREVVSRDRGNFGGYVDTEAELTKALLLGAAARFEHYTDFGSNVSGKFTARYKLTEQLALRGAANRGFRAPSLQQLSFSANDPQFGKNSAGQDDVINILHIRNDDPIVRTLGYGDLGPETSWDFSLGATGRLAGDRLTFSVDVYQIRVDNRIILSEQLDVATIPSISYLLADQNIRAVQFFTNAVDTKTKGLDLVLSYGGSLGGSSTLSTTLAATFNKTRFDSPVRTSQVLRDAGVTAVVGPQSRGLVEVAQPRDKIILSLTYGLPRFTASVRTTRFGEIADVDSRDPAGNFQVKGSKYVADVALGYTLGNFTLNAGVNNIFDVFPDKNLYGGVFDGLSPYGRSTSQFGLMGRFIHSGVTATF